jgi:hypothetical protein
MTETLQDLVDALSTELGRPVLLDDPALRPLAYSRQWGSIDNVRSESILSRGASPRVRRALFRQGIATAGDAVRTRRVPELGMEERVCVPARHDGELWGYLWLLDERAEVDAEGVARARAAAARAAELLAARAPVRSWLADESALVAGLRSDSPGAAGAEVRARGLLPAGPYVALLVDAGRPDTVLARLGPRLSPGHALAGSADDGLALLWSLADPVLSVVRPHEVAARARQLVNAPAGQSATTESLDRAQGAWRQAAIALRVARGLATKHAAWDELGANRLVAQLDPRALDDVPAGVTALVRDEPVLAATAAAFLDAAGDVQATAAALNLHRSGVYYRLRRVAELTGLDLADGDARLQLHLALRLGGLDSTSVQRSRGS